MGTLFQDIRYGFRMLARNPGFAVTAVLCLGLGIGSCTAMFSVVNSVLLNPLTVEDPDRVVSIREVTADRRPYGVSPLFFYHMQQRGDVFEAMTGFDYTNMSLSLGSYLVLLEGSEVTPHFFTVLQTQPLLGRGFLPGEGGPGNDQVVVLSYGCWQRYFGSNPDLVGTTIMLRRKPYTVIGIMPAQFQFPQGGTQGEFWMPNDLTKYRGRQIHNLTGSKWHVAARLKSGVSMSQAQAVADIIARQLGQEYPKHYGERTIQMLPLQAVFSNKKLQQTLWALQGAILFVLLIACANIANLLLARAEKRQKEIAIRMAVGASRLHVIRQLLTESILLALLGGALGLALSTWAIDLLMALVPPTLPRMKEIGVDGVTLGFTVLASIVAGLGFGLVPAWRSSKSRLDEALKEGRRRVDLGLGHMPFRSLLVGSEVAMALVLLVGAGLMIQTVIRLLRDDPGFDPHNVVRFMVLHEGRSGNRSEREPIVQEMVERLASLPGVVRVGVRHRGQTRHCLAEGQTNPVQIQFQFSGVGVADDFRALRIPLLKGRLFTEADNVESQSSIIINETMARSFWTVEDAVDQRLRTVGQGKNTEYVVVGVVGDTKMGRFDPESIPVIYEPHSRDRYATGTLFYVRTSVDPLTLTDAIRAEVHACDKSQQAFDIFNEEELLASSTQTHRLYTMYLGFFAVAALVLASLGVYGIISYSVAQRTHEMGVRMALGAQRMDVFKLVIKKGLTLIVVGLLIGVAAALALTRVLTNLLYGVTPTDPFTFVVVSLFLTAIGLVACYIPARRATKIDPMSALRYE
jgi:putative ABC transport system permease protein